MEETNDVLEVGKVEEPKVEETVVTPEPEVVEVIHETADGVVIEHPTEEENESEEVEG